MCEETCVCFYLKFTMTKSFNFTKFFVQMSSWVTTLMSTQSWSEKVKDWEQIHYLSNVIYCQNGNRNNCQNGNNEMGKIMIQNMMG